MGSRKRCEILAKFCCCYRKSGSPSTNMTSDFVPELAKCPKSSLKPPNTPKWGSWKRCMIHAKFRCRYRKSVSLSKNMTSDFVPEPAKYPKSSLKSPNTPKWDLENNVRYVQNFVALIGNRGRRARIWRQILHRKWLNSPNVAPNSKVVQNSVRAYCLTLLSDAACLFGGWSAPIWGRYSGSKFAFLVIFGPQFLKNPSSEYHNFLQLGRHCGHLGNLKIWRNSEERIQRKVQSKLEKKLLWT